MKSALWPVLFALAWLPPAPAAAACTDCVLPGAAAGGKDLAQLAAGAQEAAQRQPWRLRGEVREKKDPLQAAIFLQQGKGQEWRLLGPLAAEVGRLVGGAKVEVGCAPPTADTCAVLSYQIVATESGRRPLLGQVLEEDGQLYLETRLPLAPAAEKALRPHLGQKIYVEGVVEGGRLARLRRLGVLQEASAAGPPRP